MHEKPKPKDPALCALLNCPLKINGRDWLRIPATDDGGVEVRMGFCSRSHLAIAHDFLRGLPHEIEITSGLNAGK